MVLSGAFFCIFFESTVSSAGSWYSAWMMKEGPNWSLHCLIKMQTFDPSSEISMSSVKVSMLWNRTGPISSSEFLAMVTAFPYPPSSLLKGT